MCLLTKTLCFDTLKNIKYLEIEEKNIILVLLKGYHPKANSVSTNCIWNTNYVISPFSAKNLIPQWILTTYKLSIKQSQDPGLYVLMSVIVCDPFKFKLLNWENMIPSLSCAFCNLIALFSFWYFSRWRRKARQRNAFEILLGNLPS